MAAVPVADALLGVLVTVMRRTGPGVTGTVTAVRTAGVWAGVRVEDRWFYVQDGWRIWADVAPVKFIAPKTDVDLSLTELLVLASGIDRLRVMHRRPRRSATGACVCGLTECETLELLDSLPGAPAADRPEGYPEVVSVRKGAVPVQTGALPTQTGSLPTQTGAIAVA
jgi:hypothetical protein